MEVMTDISEERRAVLLLDAAEMAVLLLDAAEMAVYWPDEKEAAVNPSSFSLVFCSAKPFPSLKDVRSSFSCSRAWTRR
jgi:hypothetical protein